ncbi:hypothetical protein [Sphingobium sp.]|uniref:hypothetical protein n=1 Tax=Sphingobium sp. TaxID=1912891 RepID=UPI002CDA8EE1|nr:hypothetical protein [Sphingobium sp.]HUD91109.1 hypothetical protein [Sphingobium sp.]
MASDEKPSPRRLGTAAALICGIVLALFIVIFVARNVWHGEELEQDQATGNNVATEHTGPSYSGRP